MALTINKKYQYIEYLGNDIEISQISNRSNIQSIIGVTDDGIGYSSWDTNSSLNSLLSLKSKSGYLIVSKNNNPNYVLYSENDVSIDTTIKTISQTLTIAKYRGTESKLIDNLLIADNINQIFSISEDGLNPTVWSASSTLNSLLSLENNKAYLIYSDTVPYNFYSVLPVTPTPTITPTATITPTITSTISPTPTLTPTSTVTPTVTVSVTPSPTSTITPTPTNTPGLPPTPSPTVTPSFTPTCTITPTQTVTPSYTPLPPNKSFKVFFDSPLYKISCNNNYSQSLNLLSLTIVGKENINYSYSFSSESANAVLSFDNQSGLISLEPNNSVYTGKIFSNISVDSKNGQCIAKCVVTNNLGESLDALAVVILEE
jgi:hypothetical protein